MPRALVNSQQAVLLILSLRSIIFLFESGLWVLDKSFISEVPSLPFPHFLSYPQGKMTCPVLRANFASDLNPGYIPDSGHVNL